MALKFDMIDSTFTPVVGRAGQAKPNPFLDAISLLLDTDGKPKAGKSVVVLLDDKDSGAYIECTEDGATSKTDTNRIKRWLTQAAKPHKVSTRSKFDVVTQGTGRNVKHVVRLEFFLTPPKRKGESNGDSDA